MSLPRGSNPNEALEETAERETDSSEDSSSEAASTEEPSGGHDAYDPEADPAGADEGLLSESTWICKTSQDI